MFRAAKYFQDTDLFIPAPALGCPCVISPTQFIAEPDVVVPDLTDTRAGPFRATDAAGFRAVQSTGVAARR